MSVLSEYTFQPGDTSFVIVPEGSRKYVLKDCVQPGTYLFYSVVSDEGHYREYFDGSYIWSGGLRYGSQYKPVYDEMNRSLMKKLRLFRPATVHITE